VRCDGREDCSGGTPACVANDCVECDSRSDCGGAAPACVSNACVQCDSRTDCSGGTPACVGNAWAACLPDNTCVRCDGREVPRRSAGEGLGLSLPCRAEGAKKFESRTANGQP
jgi:hypothetical protein